MFAFEDVLRPVRRKRALVIALTAVLILLFASTSVFNYRRARDQEVETLQGYADRTAVAIDDRVSRLIENSDGYLRTLRVYLAEHPGLDDDGKRQAFRQFIERTRPRDPQQFLGDIAVVDGDGRLAFMLSQATPSSVVVADVSFFRALKADPRDRLIIDPTRISRTVPELRFRLVRPILADGRFQGLVLMSIRPESIIDLFDRFGPGPNSTISVAQLDERRYLARIPVGGRDYFDRPFGENDVWQVIEGSRSGVFTGQSHVDGIARHYTYVRSPDVPVVTFVGFADQDIDAAVAGTRHAIELEVLGFALGALAICGLVLYVINVEERLHRSRIGLEHGQRIGRIGTVEVDLRTGVAQWSKELFAIYGRDPALGSIQREEYLAMVHPDDKDKADLMRHWQLEGVDGRPIEYRVCLPDGRVRWIHREVEMQRDAAGKALSLIATEQDITERRRMQSELQDEHARLQFAQRMARMGSAEIDLRTAVAVRSDELYRLVGADPAVPMEESDDRVPSYFHPDDRPKIAEAIRMMLAGQPVPPLELRAIGADGAVRWLRRNQEFMRGEDGKPERAVVTLLDITDQKLLQIQKDEFAQKLISLANHDSLTGLPALRLAHDRLQVACNQAQRDNSHTAVLFIDLDGFKEVNDRLGHGAGDAVLKTVATRLAEAIRSGDTAARHGGDEFLVILNNAPAEAAKQVAGKLVDAICKPIALGGETVSIGASIGIALFPDHAAVPSKLIECADQAMYTVKKTGKNGYRLHAAP